MLFTIYSINGECVQACQILIVVILDNYVDVQGNLTGNAEVVCASQLRLTSSFEITYLFSVLIVRAVYII